MGSRRRNINDSNRDDSWNERMDRIDDGMLISSEDRTLFDAISRYMMGRNDLEEVNNDSDLPVAENLAKEMINDYRSKRQENNYAVNFVRQAFAEINQTDEINEDIREIKSEIREKNLDKITSDWIREWNEQERDNAAVDSKAKEIKDFIKRSFEDDESGHETAPIRGRRRKKISKTLIRYILPAAAVISVFIGLRILLPATNPDRLFNLYYEPLKAVSPITRTIEPDQQVSYIQAIEKFNAGDYQGAAIGFSDAIRKDNTDITPRFFLGITQLALENYDHSINLLSEVAHHPGIYNKESQWYLGLAYLKTGDTGKALACFEPLANTPGFYQAGAEKIVRRLK
jgi:TolA-binding protein